jgi:hypothetical protein
MRYSLLYLPCFINPNTARNITTAQMNSQRNEEKERERERRKEEEREPREM